MPKAPASAALYEASPSRVDLVTAPPAPFLMIDGDGDPANNPDFHQAMQALYAVAAGVKAAVTPLEGLWWMADNREFDPSMKGFWRWTRMLRVAGTLTGPVVQAASLAAAPKQRGLPVHQVRLGRFVEGQCLQTLHVGPYDAQAAAIARMKTHARERDLLFIGRHHHPSPCPLEPAVTAQAPAFASPRPCLV